MLMMVLMMMLREPVTESCGIFLLRLCPPLLIHRTGE